MLDSKASVLGFKHQSSLLEVDVAGDLNLKQVLIYHSKNPRAFKNSAKPTLPLFYKRKNKTDHSMSVDNTVYYFKPTIEI